MKKNSHISSNFNEYKNKLDIEDIILEFQDSGEITKLDIIISPITNYKLELHFNSNLSILDRLKVLDKIINKLKRKYKYIYIEYNVLCIDLTNRNSKYINCNPSEVSNLYVQVKNLLDEKLGGLEEFSNSREAYNIFYGKDADHLVLNYDNRDMWLYVSDKMVWIFFRDHFMLCYVNISRLIKEYVVNTYQIDVFQTAILKGSSDLKSFFKSKHIK